MSEVQKQFVAAIAKTKIKIIRFKPSAKSPIEWNRGRAVGIPKFSEVLWEELAEMAGEFPLLARPCHRPAEMEEILDEYAKKNKLKTEEVDRSGLEGLVLNIDPGGQANDSFYVTTADEVQSAMTGVNYIRLMRMKEEDAVSHARRAYRQYLPRSPKGISDMTQLTGEDHHVFNTYIRPAWENYEGKLPDKLPVLFEKLINHLLPLRIEREYFFYWLYASLFNRAFVYLLLCGSPGSGKNRLKLVMRALHGHSNTVDGKRSTFSERFNAQLGDNTLAWFDELRFNEDMENAMKEVQNDSISIEKKGIDATRSTRIYASLAISNNKPRDNHIAFDARKFTPLVVANSKLGTAMTDAEIDALTGKVENWNSPTFDIAFLAQIGRYVKKHYANNTKFPHLEYKGPMFWKLAHTSMTRWQKKAVTIILDSDQKVSSRVIQDEDKGYLWSSLVDHAMKKNGDRSLHFPDHSSAQHFFDHFRDAKGKKTFETVVIPGNHYGDFWVRSINDGAKIMTEAQVMEEIGDEEGEETYDL